VNYRMLKTSIGELMIVGDADGLRAIHFHGGVPEASWTEGGLDDAVAQLTAYFAGDLRDFDLELSPAGTDFQQAVWGALREIPYGETTTYGAIAADLGKPKASRAVGLANGRNPLPIVVPCHRVIGKNGSLTGFAGGLDIKRRLLDLERGGALDFSRQ